MIDAHCHVWPNDDAVHALAPGVSSGDLRPSGYPIEQHLSRLAPLGVTAAVLVPHIAYYGRDLGYALDCKARFPDACVVMGAITGTEIETPSRLSGDLGNGVRSFRIRAIDLDRPLDRLCRLLADQGCVLCPLITPAQAGAGALARIRALASQHPSLRFVLDHFAGSANSPALRALADLPNVLVKVSGFNWFDQPPYASAASAAIELCGVFGADRLMWGTDMPVFEVDGGQSLAEAHHAIHSLTALSAADRQALLGGTAERIFFTN